MKQPVAYIRKHLTTLRPILDNLDWSATDPTQLQSLATTPEQAALIRSSMLPAIMEAAGWTAFRPEGGGRWHHKGRFTRVVFLERRIQAGDEQRRIYEYLGRE